MAALAKLTAIKEAGKPLTQEELDCVSDLLAKDISDTVKAVDNLTITVPGPQVTLIRTTGKSELASLSRVLNLPELRDQILGYLTAKHLLLDVQLVCRAFRDTVQSGSLKRALYRARDDNREPPVRLPFEMHGIRNARVSKNCIVVVPSKITDLAKQRETLRNTFITQPPKRTLKLESNFNPMSAPSSTLRDYTIYKPDGLTYGDMFDEIDKMKKEGLIEEFKNVSLLRGSEKLVFRIMNWPKDPESWQEQIYRGIPEGPFMGLSI